MYHENVFIKYKLLKNISIGSNVNKKKYNVNYEL